MALCDGCLKERRNVRSCGRDANGEPDAPDLCFICRREAERGRFFNYKRNRYERPLVDFAVDSLADDSAK